MRLESNFLVGLRFRDLPIAPGQEILEARLSVFSAALALGAPWRTAFPPPLPALRIEADPGTPRGSPATVTIRAEGRPEVELVTLVAGEPVERRLLPVPASGDLEALTPPVEAATRALLGGK